MPAIIQRSPKNIHRGLGFKKDDFATSVPELSFEQAKAALCDAARKRWSVGRALMVLKNKGLPVDILSQLGLDTEVRALIGNTQKYDIDTSLSPITLDAVRATNVPSMGIQGYGPSRLIAENHMTNQSGFTPETAFVPVK